MENSLGGRACSFEIFSIFATTRGFAVKLYEEASRERNVAK